MTTVKLYPLEDKVNNIGVGDYVLVRSGSVYMVIKVNESTYNLIGLNSGKTECVPKNAVSKFYGTITIDVER